MFLKCFIPVVVEVYISLPIAHSLQLLIAVNFANVAGLCFQISLWGYAEQPAINSLALKPTANITSLPKNMFS